MSWIDHYPYAGTEAQTRSVGMALLYYLGLLHGLVIAPLWKRLSDGLEIRRIVREKRSIR